MTSRPPVPGVRHRGLALLAAVALVGTPLLVGAPAAAQDTDTVTFNARCGLLGGWSAVDPSELAVEPGAPVKFVNESRRRTTLTVGDQQETLRRGESVTLTFEDGPAVATVTLGVWCSSSEVAVTVAAPAAPSPAPSPVDDDEPPNAPAPDPSPSAVGGAYGDGNVPSGSDRPGGWWPGADAEVDDPEPLPGNAPADGAMSQQPSGPVSGATGQAEPAPSGSPTIHADLTPTAASGDDTSIGLLALLATVCVVGVSAGAIRVLLGQRSARSPA